MGVYATLCVGIAYPARALVATLAGTGSRLGARQCGRLPQERERDSQHHAAAGSAAVAKTYGMGPARIPFEVKGTRGGSPSSSPRSPPTTQGAGNTLRGYQVGRPSIYDFEADIKRIALPTLTSAATRDDCIEPSMFLKKQHRGFGARGVSQERHTVNIEERRC